MQIIVNEITKFIEQGNRDKKRMELQRKTSISRINKCINKLVKREGAGETKLRKTTTNKKMKYKQKKICDPFPQ